MAENYRNELVPHYSRVLLRIMAAFIINIWCFWINDVQLNCVKYVKFFKGKVGKAKVLIKSESVLEDQSVEEKNLIIQNFNRYGGETTLIKNGDNHVYFNTKHGIFLQPSRLYLVQNICDNFYKNLNLWGDNHSTELVLLNNFKIAHYTNMFRVGGGTQIMQNATSKPFYTSNGIKIYSETHLKIVDEINQFCTPIYAVKDKNDFILKKALPNFKGKFPPESAGKILIDNGQFSLKMAILNSLRSGKIYNFHNGVFNYILWEQFVEENWEFFTTHGLDKNSLYEFKNILEFLGNSEENINQDEVVEAIIANSLYSLKTDIVGAAIRTNEATNRIHTTLITKKQGTELFKKNVLDLEEITEILKNMVG